MTDMKVTEKDGFEVFIEKTGRFYVVWEDSPIWGDTLAEVLDKAKKARKAKKVSIDYPLIDLRTGWRNDKVPTGRRGTIYGIHSGNHNLMVRWTRADGSTETEQLTGYGRQGLFRAMSEEDLAEWRRLKELQNEASKGLATIEKRYEIKAEDINAELKKAGLK